MSPRTIVKGCRIAFGAIAMIGAGLGMPAFGQAYGIENLGTLGLESRAWDTSADGSVVAGDSMLFSDVRRAFRWTAKGGMQDLGTLGGLWSRAEGVSADGTTIVGHAMTVDTVYHACIWHEGGVENIGDLGTWSLARAVSADGSVVVGEYQAPGITRAFRWTEDLGMTDVGSLGGGVWSHAYGVSDDGSVIVGSAWISGDPSDHAFRWTSAGGVQDLGTLGGLHSFAWAVSADGDVVVGSSKDGSGTTRAFRWTAATGMQDLGVGGSSSEAYDVSADGSVVVGYYFPEGGRTAFRWTAETGAVNLTDLGEHPGAEAYGVSADGNTIIGQSFITGGERRGVLWSAQRDTDGDGLLDEWETIGIPYLDSDGVAQRYVLPFADPMRKNLYVEIDAMLNFQPPNMDRVIGAFSQAPVTNPDGSVGITLYIESDETDLAVETLNDSSGWPARFGQLRDERFGTPAERATGDDGLLAAKDIAYRYCLFVNTTTRGILGLAESVYCADFLVAKGQHLGICPSCTPVEDNEIIRSTFMHEFGHALGLEHGGDQPINYKPNYVSVMNYSEMMPYALNHQLWRLDFSPGTLPDLSEQHLDELNGLVDPTGRMNGRITYFGPGVCGDPMCDPLEELVDIQSVTVGTTAVDWNGDDSFDADVCANLNSYNAASAGCETLRDHDDWSALQYQLPGVIPGPGSPPDELTGEQVQELMELLPAPCRGDIAPDYGNGVVGVEDLLAMLAAWGACGAECAADIEPRLIADDVVDVQDLLTLLAHWGDCP